MPSYQTNMELTCERCGVIAEPVLIEAGPHIKATCPNCDGYIKFIPRDRKDFTFHFGKYKDRTLTSMKHPDEVAYLRWALLQQKFFKRWERDLVELHLSGRLQP